MAHDAQAQHCFGGARVRAISHSAHARAKVVVNSHESEGAFASGRAA